MLGLTVHTVDDGSVTKSPLYSGASYSLPTMMYLSSGNLSHNDVDVSCVWEV